MARPRPQTKDLDFDFSEDELDIDLGIPRPDHDDEEPHEGATGEEHPQDWQLKTTARLLRGPLREGVLKPVLRLFCKLHILGRENFKGLQGPIIVAANHTSHFDTPVVFETLPKTIRNKMATAAAADHWFKNKTKGILPGVAYGAIPFPRKGGLGLKHCIQLLEDGWSVLIFPEGTRSASGEMSSFKLGAGRMAVATQRPIVPVHLRGLQRILPKDKSLPRRGDVWVAVGPAVVRQPDETAEGVTQRLQASVTSLGQLLDQYDSGHVEGPIQPEEPGLY
ncbi:MAG TPA: lysophospholipid acyltransferase family protein [Candidatus Xenobia bacterium]|jgi:1-acyl-sn-glycerol-3-phosphate acyltransferase